jgi:Glycosyl hydrolases family 28/Pectate lyase superfamily protein
MAESRRSFLARAGVLAAPLLLVPSRTTWAAPTISVRDRGARGDGRTTDTRAIQAAIDEAGRAGGVVVVPAGKYPAGTLRLRSGVTLRLERDAVLIASSDDSAFDPPEDHGYETFADRETRDFAFAFLQGRGLERVAIVGPGRIDGNRSSREGPKPIAFRECRGIRIHGVTVANAGNYAISLLGCDDVDIRAVTIENGHADGIDPDCCRNVSIADCTVESRDDAIVLKTSLALGVPRATEHVTVRGCRLVTQHNALKLGTESSGDFRHIVFRDCVLEGRRHFVKGELSSGISLQTVDGGTLEHVSVSNIRMKNIRAPFFVRRARRGRGQEVPTPGALRDVTIADVTATGASGTGSILGIPGYPVTGVTLRNIRVTARGGEKADAVTLSIPEMERLYPDAYLFGELPGYALYGRHVDGLVVEGLDAAVEMRDARPAVVLDDVRRAELHALRAMPPVDGGPMLWLNAVRDSTLHELRRRGTGPLQVRVSGRETARLTLVDAGTSPAERYTVTLDADVPPTVVALAPRRDRPL